MVGCYMMFRNVFLYILLSNVFRISNKTIAMLFVVFVVDMVLEENVIISPLMGSFIVYYVYCIFWLLYTWNMASWTYCLGRNRLMTTNSFIDRTYL